MTTPFVMKEIEHFYKVFFKWFDFNYIKSNSGKSCTLVSGNGNVSANIGNNTIISENKNKLQTIFWTKNSLSEIP